MNSIKFLLALCSISLLLLQCTASNDNQSTEDQSNEVIKAKQDTPELAEAMGELQRFTHKYTLSVEAQNHEAATFYFHEVRATIDGIKEEIPGYEGYDIKKFVELMLDPRIEPVETALAEGNWEEIREKTIDLVDSCNSCHNATSHGFVKITPGFEKNPYNQDFSE